MDKIKAYCNTHFNKKNIGTITHLSKTLNSAYIMKDQPLDYEKINYVRNNFYTPKEELYDKMIEQLKGVLFENKNKINIIYRYFFVKLANDCRYKSLFSINEFLESDECIQLGLNKVASKPKVFPLDVNNDIIYHFKTMLRIGNARIAGSLSNYPFKQCKELIEKYIGYSNLDENGNKKTYIDPCCGWGVRMLVSAVLNVKYIGFDTNQDLCIALNEFGKVIQSIYPEFEFEIINHGSEIYLDRLVDTADIVFTSPPYFQVEDYGKVEEDAIDITKITYKEWKESFIDKVCNTMSRYIKKGGYIIINTKDYKNEPILTDFKKGLINEGMTFITNEDLKNIKRPVMINNVLSTDESIIVTQKL